MSREAPPRTPSRRELLLAGLALGGGSLGTRVRSARAAVASSGLFSERVLSVPGPESSAPRRGREAHPRTTLILPSELDPSRPLPLLVLCHGLGESNDESLGLRAWTRLYGLTRAYERLSQPPVQRLFPKLNYLPEARMAELNDGLRAAPFAPCVIACPFTPNPYLKGIDTTNRLERFGDFVEFGLVPEIRRQLPIAEGPGSLCIAGVSMGGYVALELVVRRPHLFGALSSIQGAFGAPALGRYTDRLAHARQQGALRHLLLLSSGDDPFRAAHQQLSGMLAQRGVENQLVIRPGPHNQPWLREVGCLELLYWHDRVRRS